ncbi:MAG TPA: HIT family protein [Burkholderiaceae bacterium]|nr:HIT family protein [Burkholderiaceae bacterium]
MSPDCELCRHDGGRVLWRDAALRVVLVDDSEYPGFLRVIWNDHVPEMTDLAPGDRERLMRAVFGAEAALRRVLTPHKVNLASLGNMTPHLHWHVIARYTNDAHFPQPIWGSRQRTCDNEILAHRAAKLAELKVVLAHDLETTSAALSVQGR